MEASGLTTGRFAELVIPGGSSTLQTSNQFICLDFWYNMNGADVGSVIVEAESRTTAQRSNVFTRRK